MIESEKAVPEGSFSHVAGTLLRRLGKPGATSGDYDQLRSLIALGLRQQSRECLAWVSKMHCFGLVEDIDLDEAVKTLRRAEGDAATLLFATQLDHPMMRDRLIRKVIGSVGNTAPVAALDLLSAIPRHLQRDLMKQVVMQWTQKQGRTAVEALLARRDIPELILYDALLSWARHDPRAGFQLLMSAKSDDFVNRSEALHGKEQLLAEFFSAKTALPPAVALELLRSLPAGEFRRSHMATYVAKMIEKDPAQINQWLAKSGGDIASLQALETAVVDLAPNNPALAGELAKNLPGERARTEALRSAVDNIVKHKPPRHAAEFAQGLEDSLGKAMAMKTVANLWLESPQSTPNAALEYASKQVSNGGDPMLLRMLCAELSKSGDDFPNLASNLRELSPQAKQMIKQQGMGNIAPSARVALGL
ncbi:MAG: hypothetical protein V4710_04235 [Verrucomicrobiota bacterium]